MTYSRRIESIPLSCTIPGLQRTLKVIRYGSPGARPKAYFQAAIHASEMTGTVALAALADMLDVADASGKVKGEILLLPMCNPIGFGQFLFGEQSGRFEHGGRDNFNRGHYDISEMVAIASKDKLVEDADANVATLRGLALDVISSIPVIDDMTSWRTKLLAMAIDADLVLDIHSDLDAAVFMYVNQNDWPAATDVAALLGCAATILNAPYTTSTNFSGVVGALWPRLAERIGPDFPVPNACLSVLLELRGRHDVSHALAQADAKRLFSILQQRGMIEGESGELPALLAPATPILGMDVGYAPFAGPVVYHVTPGERVFIGMPICDVLDPLAEDADARVITLFARANGVLYARPIDGMVVYPGQVMFRIAGAEPLAHRMNRSWLDD